VEDPLDAFPIRPLLFVLLDAFSGVGDTADRVPGKIFRFGVDSRISVGDVLVARPRLDVLDREPLEPQPVSGDSVREHGLGWTGDEPKGTQIRCGLRGRRLRS
jgi:hypothetical protein